MLPVYIFRAVTGEKKKKNLLKVKEKNSHIRVESERIAKERGLEKMSAQAVGGGITRKKALLELEGNDMSRFTIPTKGTAL